jgi:hypothetical protein
LALGDTTEAEDACRVDRPTERSTFRAFLSQLARLTNEEAREIGEVERVTDWRRDNDSSTLLDQEFVGVNWGVRQRHALEAARSGINSPSLNAGRREVKEILARMGKNWPGRRWHRPLAIVFWVAAIAMFALALGSGLGFFGPEDEAWTLGLTVGAAFVAAGAALGRYLLPPSERDFRTVVDHAAIAHLAGPALDDDDFSQLAGGWYAVFEGRWRRGNGRTSPGPGCSHRSLGS